MDGKPKKISVILPYYNRHETLAEAITSVLDQTHTDLVLYLVNDGSDDESTNVARDFADSRVIHVDIVPRQGVAHARNVGLSRASSDLVAFMDSDDVWLKQKLAIQLEFLRSAQEIDKRVAVVGSGWKIMDSGRRDKAFVAGPHSRIDVLYNRVAGLGTPMLLVDRSVAVENARFDESLPALLDRDYVISCLANGTKVVVVPETLALVRRGRVDNVATSRRVAAAFEMLANKYADELSNLPDLKSWYSYRAAREHLVHHDIRSASRHVRLSLKDHRTKRLAHLAFGLAGGRKGLAVAQRLLKLD
jgi:glycosyltransferase involved in cell wall biosynthesis